MKHKRFEDFTKEIVSKTADVLIEKGKKYSSKSTTDDRLKLFKDSGVRQKETALQALLGMWDKHIGMIYELIERHAKGENAPFEVWMETFGDNINYSILGLALVQDETDEELLRNFMKGEEIILPLQRTPDGKLKAKKTILSEEEDG